MLWKCDYCKKERALAIDAVNVACCYKCLRKKWDTGVLVDFVESCHDIFPDNRDDDYTVVGVKYELKDECDI